MSAGLNMTPISPTTQGMNDILLSLLVCINHYYRQELQAADERSHEFRTKSTPRTPSTPSTPSTTSTPSKSSSSTEKVVRSYAPTVPQAPFPALGNLTTLLHSRFLHQVSLLFNPNFVATCIYLYLDHIYCFVQHYQCIIFGH